MKHKECRTCHKSYPADSCHYFPSSHNDDGWVHNCKECCGVSFETQLPFNPRSHHTCPQCKRELPLSSYYFQGNRRSRTGYVYRCKECCGTMFGEPNGRSVPNAKSGYKICNKCKRELKLSPMFFDVVRSNKDGFHGTCRKCRGYARTVRTKRNHQAIDGHKVCYDCGANKPVGLFNKNAGSKDGISHICKVCVSRRYYRNHRSERRSSRKAYLRHRAQRVKSSAEWKKRHENTPKHRIVKNLRRRMHNLITTETMNGSCMKLLGADRDVVVRYIEKQFTRGMSWDNYGLKGWHIDHIKPFAVFDLTDENEVKECCHYTNLQPMWARDNLSKGKKYLIRK